jgi:hypothetical protein
VLILIEVFEGREEAVIGKVGTDYFELASGNSSPLPKDGTQEMF